MGLPLSRRIVFSQPLITEKRVAEIQKVDGRGANHKDNTALVWRFRSPFSKTGTGFGFRKRRGMHGKSPFCGLRRAPKNVNEFLIHDDTRAACAYFELGRMVAVHPA
jgi:hypothetical protein